MGSQGGAGYPELSRRRNGDRLVGITGPFAADLYDAGTPPVHGLAAKPLPSPRLAAVRIGDQLRIERKGDRWIVSDAQGELGVLRWRPADERSHPVTGNLIRLPRAGTLHVQRLLLTSGGDVKDIGGYVEPD
jgi:hypothetical protein